MIIIIILLILLLLLLLLLLLIIIIIIIIKWVKRFHEGEESTIQELNIKHQESETSRITANEDTESKKIVIFKITGISLEFILIYTFAGLLTILGAILLVVCINHYRKKGNRSTKRWVKSALNIPLFLHLKICNIHQSHRYACVHMSLLIYLGVLGLIIYIRTFLWYCI